MPRARAGGRWALAALAALGSMSTPARADDPPGGDTPPPAQTAAEDGEAAPLDAPVEALLDEGVRLFAVEADFDGALRAFERAYELAPSWRALNGIALVHQTRGHYVDALAAYEALVSQYGDELTPRQRATLDARIAALVGRIGIVRVRAAQVGVQVAIDGEVAGTGPLQVERRMMPGAHTVVATREGFATHSERVAVEAGATADVAIRLVPIEVKVVVRTEKPRLVRKLPGWTPWVTMGAGAAIAGIGGAVGLSASRDFGAFDREVANAAGIMPAAIEVDDHLRERGMLKRDAATGLYIAGGAVVVAGIAILVLDRPRPQRDAVPRATAVFTGTGAGVVVRF